MKIYSVLMVLCFVPLSAMDESIKKRIEKAEAVREEELRKYNPSSTSSSWEDEIVYEGNINTRYYQALRNIVQSAGNLMSNQEKLKYLIGDSCYEYRKKIAKQMVEDEHVDVKSIKYDVGTPLEDAILQEDISFATYLLERGAHFDADVLKYAQNDKRKELFAPLVAKYAK